MGKNCNECLHNPICQMWRDQEGQDASSFQLSGCVHFKDRHRFVEMPLGDTVYALYSTAEYKTRTGSRRRENKQIISAHHLKWAISKGAVEIREKQCTKTDLQWLGKMVFAAKADAERAIAEWRVAIG